MRYVFKYDPSAEFYTDERCSINELLGAAEDSSLSVARARVEPGITTVRHSLKGVTERYVILEGRGEVEVGEEPPVEVGPGDVVVIPPDTGQRISNSGKADLVFLCLCSPPFTPECYRDLEHEK